MEELAKVTPKEKASEAGTERQHPPLALEALNIH